MLAVPQRWDRTVDVIVLGSGAAGLSAAISAHDAGAQALAQAELNCRARTEFRLLSRGAGVSGTLG